MYWCHVSHVVQWGLYFMLGIEQQRRVFSPPEVVLVTQDCSDHYVKHPACPVPWHTPPAGTWTGHTVWRQQWPGSEAQCPLRPGPHSWPSAPTWPQRWQLLWPGSSGCPMTATTGKVSHQQILMSWHFFYHILVIGAKMLQAWHLHRADKGSIIIQYNSVFRDYVCNWVPLRPDRRLRFGTWNEGMTQLIWFYQEKQHFCLFVYHKNRNLAKPTQTTHYFGITVKTETFAWQVGRRNLRRYDLCITTDSIRMKIKKKMFPCTVFD